jgi:hypothetical protein
MKDESKSEADKAPSSTPSSQGEKASLPIEERLKPFLESGRWKIVRGGGGFGIVGIPTPCVKK